MLQEVLARLEGVKTAGDGYVAKCPAHEDAQASLSVKDKGDDWPLFNCFAGCSFDQVREALERLGLKREGGPKKKADRKLVKRIPYEIRDPDGDLICYHVRLEWDDGGKTFAWEMPDGDRRLRDRKADSMLFGAERIPGLPLSKAVVICEGEKAADRLREFGVQGALGTVSGASSAPTPDALAFLDERDVWLWPDNDDMGEKHMARVAKNLEGIARSVRVIRWEGAAPKADAADWLFTADRTREEFGQLLANATTPGPAPSSSEWPEGVTPIYAPALMKATMVDMEQFSQGARPGVVSTGFEKLDRALRGGFEPGEVYLIGAPTGCGKTTVMQSIGSNAARSGPVLLVTPEMTLVSLLRRELIRRSGIRESAVSQWAAPQTRQDSWIEFVRSGSQLLEEKPPLLILDKVDVSMADVEAAAEQISGLRLVLIDYAQQVADIDGRTPRYLQVGDVALRSVDLAHRLQIPVVLASQVNVVTAKGKDKRRLYSFRESSVMEQKAAVVLIFDRKDPDDESTGPDAIEAQWHCPKNRHGYTFKGVDVEWWPWLYQVAEPVPPPQLPIPTDRREPYRGDDE